MEFSNRCLFGIAALVLLSGVDAAKPKKPGGPVFGGPEPFAGALRGTVYRLPKNTSWLPDFSLLRPVGFVFTNVLDYPLRPYDDEWFGIDYEGQFYVIKSGRYNFWLTSDDGAQLYIDGKRIINNDGIHGEETEERPVVLEAGMHQLRVPYFQGPRPYISLILEVQVPGGKKRIFNTDEFRPGVR